MDFKRELYKFRKISTIEDARARRSERLTLARQDVRMKILQNRRGNIIFENVENRENVMKPVVNEMKKKKTRIEMLQQYKIEKAKKLEEQKRNQKPIFKVGVIQRKATGSPLSNVTNTFASKNFLQQNQVKGVITRSKAKLLNDGSKPVSNFSQIIKNKKKPINDHVFVVPKAVSKLPYSQKITALSSSEVIKSNNSIKKLADIKSSKRSVTKTLNVNSHNSTNNFSQSAINEVESLLVEIKNIWTSEEISSPEVSSSADKDYVPICFSPFVNDTRGSNRKPKRRSKLNLSMDVDEQIQKEENVFRCRIFSFRKYVECQTERLMEMCSTWAKARESFQLPLEVQGDIDCVIGKTKLLTSDKFKQFKDLIDKCENKDPMIKIDDLQGFQDWVSIEVEKISESFYKLEKMKANGWKPDTVEAKKGKPTKPGKMTKDGKEPSKQPPQRSNLRAHIAAARKLMNPNSDFGSLSNLHTWSEGKSPSATPKKECLIRNVLTSEAQKRASGLMRSPGSSNKARDSVGLEMLVVTQKLKHLTPTKDLGLSSEREPTAAEPEMVVNTGSAPKRSILKVTPTSCSTARHRVVFSPQVSLTRISEKYFAPAVDDEEDSPSVNEAIAMTDCSSTTPQSKSKSKRQSKTAILKLSPTPVRKSARQTRRRSIYTP